ncbi:MAG: diguanylate cyclase [Chromatiales bacterium]|nr:diguanylate cyclase [Chromatiales bacterium]
MDGQRVTGHTVTWQKYFMSTIHLKNFSVQHLAIATILLVGSTSLASFWVAENIFRDAITSTIRVNINNIVNVAVQETMNKLRGHAIQFTNRTQNYATLHATLNKFLKNPKKGKETSDLIEQLNSPFIKGYVDAIHLELLKLRIYDLNYQPLTESSHGIELPYGLPQFLEKMATGRKGSKRLKALGGLWSSNGQPLYSVLVPIGGLRIKGYIEAVFNPAFNIGAIDQITHIPVIITSSNEALLYRSDSINLRSTNRLSVAQPILGDDGHTVFQIRSFEDISGIYKELYAAKTILGGGLLLSNIIIVIFAIWLLYRFLLSPLIKITQNIDQMTDHNTKVHIEPTGLREFRHLAKAFNGMYETVRTNTQKLEILSSTDGLTNIANHRAFDTALAREWRYCNREQLPISLLYIDIDFFKNYNDHYGHQRGDDCLKNIAHLIDGCARRPSDLAARYGGEEFVVLLSDTDGTGAYAMAQTLMTEIHRANYPHKNSSIAHHVTLSIGISTLVPSDRTSQNQLIKLADEALYRSKSAGRNRITTT